MKRRLFTKIFAFCAGAISVMQVRAVEPTPHPSSNNGDRGDIGSDGGDKKLSGGPAGSGTDRDPVQIPVNVAEFMTLAKAKLPKATYEYITTGSEDEITLRDNVAAFRRIKVLPPLLTGVGKSDLSTTILDQRVSLPVLLAPAGVQQLFHPQGALASARAAAAAGTIFVVSTSAGHSVEEIAAVTSGPLWFQLYVPQDRKVAQKLVQRVERAGYRAIVVTVDLGERKDADRRNNFTVPKHELLKMLRDVGHEQLSDRLSYDQLIQFNAQAWRRGLSWDFFDWLRSITQLPILIKGVLREKDARKAVSLGLDGIIVSNHGGRRLDGMPASIDQLPDVVKAVEGRAEVLLDGGVRRGTDVLKAIALGAKAVLIGRPYAWALAADGEAGVKQVVELFREELQNACVTCGCAQISDIESSLVERAMS